MQQSTEISEFGFRNQPLMLRGDQILKNLQTVQVRNGLKRSERSSGPGVNLSIEMETGTGKTYTYVKTMYELNARYGWSKFIIVVPSVAIREGVYKSLQTTRTISPESMAKSCGFSSIPPIIWTRWTISRQTAPSM